MKDGIIKKVLIKVYIQYQLIILKIKYNISIMNSLETIEYIKKNRCNIARYGDGEFNIMQISGDKADIAFQKYDEKLKNALRNTLRKRHNLLICIPYTFCNKKNLNKNAKRFWIGYCLKKQRDIVIYLRENACGGV